MDKDIKESGLRSFLPSPPDGIFILLLLYLSFVAPRLLLSDADTGYHIRTGQHIMETRSVPEYDIFSHHEPPPGWTLHEWLSEVIMAVLNDNAGLTGVVLFFAFLIAFSFYLLYRSLRTIRLNGSLAAFIALFAALCAQLNWFARPHAFTFLFIVIFNHVLGQYQYKGVNRLFVLPVAALLWANLHGGVIFGLLIGGIYFSGNLLYLLSRKEPKEDRLRKTKTLGAFLVLSVAASLINPSGYRLLALPFTLMSKRFIMNIIGEYLSPNFHEFMFYTYFILFAIVVLAVSKKGLDIIETALLAFFAYMSLYSVRHIPLFAIVSAPIVLKQAEAVLAETKTGFLDFLRKKPPEAAQLFRPLKGYVWFCLAAALFASYISFSGIRYGFHPSNAPVDAVGFIMSENIEGNMFNYDEFGDYVIYAAWPEYRVFIDGRNDMYGEEVMKEYFKVLKFEPGWEEVLEKYRMGWIFVKTDFLLTRHLLKDDGWAQIYGDDLSAIFVRNSEEYRPLIERYSPSGVGY